MGDKQKSFFIIAYLKANQERIVPLDDKASEIYREAYARECPHSLDSLFKETFNNPARVRQQYEVVKRVTPSPGYARCNRRFTPHI